MEYQSILHDVQKVQLDILNAVATICKNNNIEFFLVGGTALGAKRHQGFIPWDDDIDIGMTRSHYEQFLKIAQKELEKDLFLQTPYTERQSPYPYAKVRKEGTKFLEWSNRKLKIHDGIYIDIFPYDNVPNSYAEKKRQFNKVQFFAKLYVWKKTPDLTKPTNNLKKVFKFVFRKVWHNLLRVIPSYFILKRLNKNMTRYNQIQTTEKACLLTPRFLSEYLKSSTLYPLQMAVFEKELFPVPNNLDLYLKTQYGDYMKFPPEEDRKGHRPYKLEIGE